MQKQEPVQEPVAVAAEPKPKPKPKSKSKSKPRPTEELVPPRRSAHPPQIGPNATQIAVPAKRPVGRPTKYTPELAERIVGFMAQGFSLEAASAQVDVSLKITFDWQHRIPGFREVINRGKALSLAWWEARARDAAEGTMGGSAQIISLGLRNRAKSSIGWHHGGDGNTVNVKHSGVVTHEHTARIDVTALAPEQRDQLRALLMLAHKPAATQEQLPHRTSAQDILDAEFSEVGAELDEAI